jgi:hypothetical protein
MRGFTITLNNERYRVRFQTKDRVVYCRLSATDLEPIGEYDSVEIKTKSICHENDTFDEFKGAHIAFTRAIRKFGNIAKAYAKASQKYYNNIIELHPLCLEVRFEAEKQKQIRKANKPKAF